MGFNTLNDDTYTLMMLSDRTHDWGLGFVVWVLQSLLSILAILGFVGWGDRDDRRFTIPYATSIEVTIAQPLSIFVMFYIVKKMYSTQ